MRINMIKNYSVREIIRMATPYVDVVVDMMTAVIINTFKIALWIIALTVEWVEIAILMRRWMVRRIPGVVDVVRDMVDLLAAVVENTYFDAIDLIGKVGRAVRAGVVAMVCMMTGIWMNLAEDARVAWAFREELCAEARG